MGMRKTLKKIYALLEWKQKVIFIMILLIMLLSSALTQVTPKAIGWLTDDIFAEGRMAFIELLPMLLLILIVNVVNELLKKSGVDCWWRIQRPKLKRKRAHLSLLLS